MRSKFLVSALVLFAIAAVLGLTNSWGLASMPQPLLIMTRWLVLAALIGYAAVRRSLTTSILVGMLVGAEIGHDWPAAAVNLRVLSQIFLRMIKTIVAPLLFATLVVGIAGHADLKKVGRMGIKALIYFEVVTTIALFIGLFAINVSGAGVGIQLPPASGADKLQAAKQTATDVILHAFPENIAKSVAEGQLLQIVVFSIIFGIALALIKESKRQPL